MASDDAQHQEEIILALTSYQREDYDRPIITTPPGIHALVQPFITEAFTTDAVTALGCLQALPVEIIVELCRAMDITTLFRFRQANRRTRQIISGIKAYRESSTHALESFRAILRLGVNTATIVDLYWALHGPPKCATCDRFGYLLFLPTMQRCCATCLENWSSPSYSIAPATTVAKLIGIRHQRLRRIVDSTRSLTGPFLHGEYRGSKRYNLVTQDEVARLFPDVEPKSAFFPGPISKAFDAQWGKFVRYRYMVTTFIPHIDRASGIIERRYSCDGCRKFAEKGRHFLHSPRENVTACFSREQFLEHFRTCPFAHRIWKGC
ncbi:hypothetical protein MCOR25_000587 [Pyricularia grisea]|uniref:F-box domain-containing protein n=1 Tax=Pyricularia grisea TaxID=148305 RepID=A0A6P8BLR0_PYRGI|nr:uncharacterized protein PgNI_02420 [Pyricularia grisea]KAI6382584.1 hypothetical protein MCOR25_000587 [Pyricularia grisea]TLD17629.1 hypothetical protein PgNI_02420 [Pyricularia grisea]